MTLTVADEMAWAAQTDEVRQLAAKIYAYHAGADAIIAAFDRGFTSGKAGGPPPSSDRILDRCMDLVTE